MMMTLTMNSRKSYVPLDNRYAERVAVTCRVRYVGEDSDAASPRRRTHEKYIRFWLPRHQRPPGDTWNIIDPYHCASRWIAPTRIEISACCVGVGCQFSVRFMDLSQDHRKRLQSFIWKSISHHTVSDQRTRFRLRSLDPLLSGHDPFHEQASDAHQLPRCHPDSIMLIL